VGAFNEFVLLKQGGEKQFRYKQEKMVEATKGLVSAEEFGIGAKGICDALALRWLAERLRGRQAFGQGNFHVERHVNDVRVTQEAFAVHGAIAQNHARMGGAEALKAAAQDYGMHLDTRAIEENDVKLSVANFLVECEYECRLLEIAHYMTYAVWVGDDYIGRHATAMIGIRDECYFFDSNIGEYRITDMALFAPLYELLYKGSSFKWQISGAMKCEASVEAG
jgi:hypothetical protein